MNAMYIDPYARFSHTRHWVSNTNNKKKKATVAPSPPPIKKFNANVIDTFCFRWPDMHSYVLVHVLEKTIAIFPVHSRLAFLYFHHAPTPKLPSLPEEEQHVKTMFNSWKHTLAVEQEQEEERQNVKVTLGDVIAHEPNLAQGWIHAPCTVSSQDENKLNNNTIVLNTKHTTLRLTARCLYEKRMFLNLVRIKQEQELEQPPPDISHDEDDDDSSISSMESKNDISADTVINHLRFGIIKDLENIQDKVSELNRIKEDISTFTHQLLELDQSLDTLLDSTLNVQFHSLERVLDFVNHQLADSIIEFNKDRDRISNLQERVSVHNVFLKGTIDKYEQITRRVRSHAWYPWLYTVLAGLVLLSIIYVSYYNYNNYYEFY